MKNLKLLFLTILLTTVCTGCSIEYNITINENSIDETITIIDNMSNSRTENDILNHYNMWYPVFVNYVTEGETIELEDFREKVSGIEYYNKSIQEIENGYQYSYNYNYNIDDYYDSYALATTFIEPNVYKTNKSLILKSSKENLLCNYSYFDELKINITIDSNVYKLNHTNTSYVDNNTYTWILDKNNCQDSQIILTLDSINNNKIDNVDNILDKENPTINKNEKDYSIYIFFGILIVLILIGYFIINKIKEKNNKMNEDD